MSADDNKSVNLRWIQAWNERDWTTEAAYRAANYVARSPGFQCRSTMAGWNAFNAEFTGAFLTRGSAPKPEVAELAAWRAAWDDYRYGIAGRSRASATGRLVAFSGVDFSRVVDGKIAEHGRSSTCSRCCHESVRCCGRARIEERRMPWNPL